MGAGSPEGVEADKPQEMLWKDWEMARIDLVGGAGKTRKAGRSRNYRSQKFWTSPEQGLGEQTSTCCGDGDGEAAKLV